MKYLLCSILFMFHFPGASASESIVGSGSKETGRIKFPSLEDQVKNRSMEIMIPEVEFTDVKLSDALEVMRWAAKEQDPKRMGIPIKADLDPIRLTGPKRGHDDPDMLDPLNDRITVSLRNVSLWEALRFVVGAAGSRVRPVGRELTIIHLTISLDAPSTATFPLAGANEADLDRIRRDPKRYFSDFGVLFPEGSSCAFAGDGTTLVVVNTPQQIELIHRILEKHARLKDKPSAEAR